MKTIWKKKIKIKNNFFFNHNLILMIRFLGDKVKKKFCLVVGLFVFIIGVVIFNIGNILI